MTKMKNFNLDIKENNSKIKDFSLISFLKVTRSEYFNFFCLLGAISVC